MFPVSDLRCRIRPISKCLRFMGQSSMLMPPSRRSTSLFKATSGERNPFA
jgi:hypothetical protein